LTIARTTNQIVLGSTNTTTITSTAPSASRVYTIADAGGAASFVMTAGAQTIGGAKTFSTAVIINPTTNQIVLGVTNTTTITSTAPSASRVYTIADAGGAASFVMTAGAQTLAGIKTFSTGIAISGGASANNTIYLQTNVFSIRGGTSGFSIRSTADVANIDVSDAGAVTFGPSAGLTGASHLIQSQRPAANACLNIDKTTVAANTNNNFYVAFRGTSAGDDGYIQTNGSAVLTLVDASDARIKTNVRDASYGLHTINALRPVEYDRIDSDIVDVKGFIAQEVKEVLPESVSIKESGKLKDFHFLEMQTMIPVLVKALQELSAKNDALEARLLAAGIA